MSREVRWLPRAQKDLKRLDPPSRARLVRAVTDFAQTGQGDVRRMVNVTPPEFRLRVGVWRVRFSRDDEHQLIHVLRVRHRSKAYR